MNAPIVRQRRPNGTLLPGQPAMNPGGRPRTAIEQLRARLLPRLPEFMDGLIELAHSPNEATRLAAIREILDRLLGKPAVFVDATTTRLDIGQLYLAALKRVNGVPTNQTISADHEVSGDSNRPTSEAAVDVTPDRTNQW
jgi:hypothetical protein